MTCDFCTPATEYVPARHSRELHAEIERLNDLARLWAERARNEREKRLAVEANILGVAKQ